MNELEAIGRSYEVAEAAIKEAQEKIERHDDWRTPDDVWQPLNEIFGFTLDAAADGDNAKTCEFINEKQDALSQDWGRGEVVWLNPPYKNLTPWIQKAIDQSANGNTIVMLIPNSRDTKWYHDLIVPMKQAGCCKTYSYRGRIKFVDPHPDAARSAPKQGNMLVVFTPPMPECWALD